MSRQKNRPMTRGLRKAIIQDEVFLTPLLPASRLKRRQASKTGSSKSNNSNFPNFSIPLENPTNLNTSKKPQENSIVYNHQTSYRNDKNDASDIFFDTPTGTKLVRPDPGVFHSTGFLLKKNQLRNDSQNKFFTPETPCKKNSMFVSSKFSHTSAPPSFALSSFTTSQPYDTSPLLLGKHPNVSFENLLYNKRRYISPCDSFSQPFNPDSKQEQSSPLHHNIRDNYSDDIFQPNRQKDNDSFFIKPSSFNLNLASIKNLSPPQKSLLNRTRGSSFAHSEVETTFSSASTLQTFGNRAEPNVKMEKSNFDTVDLMQCDSGPGTGSYTLPLKSCDSNHFSDNDNYSKSPLNSSSPLITPDERPQMPQIVNGYATNYPHFLNKDYFSSSSSMGPVQDYSFRSPTYEHYPVDESGYLDYYRYQFDEIAQIGKGNFSNVLLSRSLDDGKTYAIKKSLRPFNGRKDRLKKLAEVEVLWRLSGHPNIIQISGSWEQFGLLYIQTEFCERGNLRELFSSYFNSNSVPEDNIWKILSAVANGLFYMHSIGLLHLDLKPDNICVDSQGFIKLIDLGHATYLPIVAVGDGDREGDRVYLAPESLSAAHSVSSAVDIFSLGLIILEMAANVVLPDNGPEWLALRNNDISPAALESSTVSSDLYQLVTQMLQKDPSKRPTAEQICSHPKCIAFNQIPLA